MRKRNLAKNPKEFEDPEDVGVGVGVDMADPVNEEVDVVELAVVVEIADMGKQHKQSRHFL